MILTGVVTAIPLICFGAAATRVSLLNRVPPRAGVIRTSIATFTHPGSAHSRTPSASRAGARCWPAGSHRCARSVPWSPQWHESGKLWYHHCCVAVNAVTDISSLAAPFGIPGEWLYCGDRAVLHLLPSKSAQDGRTGSRTATFTTIS